MNVNKVFLAGNLTRDPALSYLPSQTTVVDFGIATNRKWTGKDGQKQEEVCFIDCQAFGKTADTINKYLDKGRPVFIEGRLKFESWTAQDGTKRSKHKVVVEQFQFMPDGQQREPQAAEQDNTNTETHEDIPF
jgi:single-strand DNA-binding protein